MPVLGNPQTGGAAQSDRGELGAGKRAADLLEAVFGPPSPPDQFWAKLSGGSGALRDGRESARRNAQDALFPVLRTNVLGLGRGGA